MSVVNEELLRWREMSGDPGALSGRAADLVDAVRDVPPLAPEALARIKVQVLGRRPSRAGHRFPIGLRFALLAVLVLASVATARGTMVLWQRHVAAISAEPTTILRRAPVPSHARTRPPAPVPTAAADEPGVEVASPPPAPMALPARVSPTSASVARTRRIAMAAPGEPHVGTAGGAQDTIAPTTEAQWLARALSRLRQAHDPAGALSLLDQYARLFRHGILESEALSARLEAVIQMDDRKTALRLLDERGAFSGRLGSQLLLTRAELRASAGRFGEALGDFDRLLASDAGSGGAASVLSAPEQERALYGRAVCLGHLGRDDRARADLIAYQRRFLDGKHAAEVARLLKDAGSEKRP